MKREFKLKIHTAISRTRLRTRLRSIVICFVERSYAYHSEVHSLVKSYVDFSDFACLHAAQILAKKMPKNCTTARPRQKK